MDTAMTLSRLADLIIVTSFFSLCCAGVGYIIAELGAMVFDGVRKLVHRHRERKKQPME